MQLVEEKLVPVMLGTVLGLSVGKFGISEDTATTLIGLLLCLSMLVASLLYPGKPNKLD